MTPICFGVESPVVFPPVVEVGTDLSSMIPRPIMHTLAQSKTDVSLYSALTSTLIFCSRVHFTPPWSLPLQSAFREVANWGVVERNSKVP